MGRDRASRAVSRRVRAPLTGLREGENTTTPELERYLRRVLRRKPGDAVTLFDPVTSREASAVLPETEGTLVCGPVREAEVVARREVVLLHGLAKGDKMDAIVRDATELGATCVTLVESERSVVKLEGKRRDERKKRLEKIAEEAARQSGRADPPRIEGPCTFREAVAKLPGDGTARRFALAPAARAPLGPLLVEALATRDAPLVFAIGPEGGLSSAELDFLEAHDFTCVSIGAFVLRTETVAAAVLGALAVLSGIEAEP